MSDDDKEENKPAFTTRIIKATDVVAQPAEQPQTEEPSNDNQTPPV